MFGDKIWFYSLSPLNLPVPYLFSFFELWGQGVGTYSQSDSAVKQKPDILQCEEGEEEDCKICDIQVHEVALWPLAQTQGMSFTVFYTFKTVSPI